MNVPLKSEKRKIFLEVELTEEDLACSNINIIYTVKGQSFPPN
jgi:hypothetical protein